MLKVLPVVFLAALCFANFGFMTFKTTTESEELPALRNHLTQDKNASAQAAPVNEVFDFEDATNGSQTSTDAPIVQREQNILRLYWDIVPNAVKYEIFIGGNTFVAFTNGIEIPVDDINAKFQVNAVSIEGTTLQNKLPIIAIDTNPTVPRTTTEFDKMDYPPIYPVYSWIPTAGISRSRNRRMTILICTTRRPCSTKVNIFGACVL